MRFVFILAFCAPFLVACAPAPPPEESVILEPPDLRGVSASRQFAPLPDAGTGSFDDFAGLAVIAFPRSVAGTLRPRAETICAAFLNGLLSVEAQQARDEAIDNQIVTIWPVWTAPVAERLNAAALGPAPDAAGICPEAVTGYDWEAGSDALEQAQAFFRARGKDDVADRIRAPGKDGPWLLGWAPGASKGETRDNVLVLAFDLSHVDTAAEAERAFQAWRRAIERDPDLWRQERISNRSWSAAIIRFANKLGRDRDFYARLAN